MVSRPPERGAPTATDTLRREVEALRQEAEGLRQALTTSPIIDMARGVVMATAPCTKEEAWQVLVELSQRTNVKLRDIARHIVSGVTGEPMPPPVRGALLAALDRIRATRG
ncbi:ANTAR domain-containing protein [Streptomyces polygonati]|uniref:ANTAR domain-containing protein n=1 Tax=Streptomyces polygonati TaxID=1617087 RepID=A0ABV8HPI8_9ACTN